MNKNAIQKFAIWARNELIAQVSQRAYQYGIDESGFGDASADTLNGRLLTAEEKSQRQELIKQIKEKGLSTGHGRGCLHLVQPLHRLALYGGQQLSALPYPRVLRRFRCIQAGDPERCAAP